MHSIVKSRHGPLVAFVAAVILAACAAPAAPTAAPSTQAPARTATPSAAVATPTPTSAATPTLASTPTPTLAVTPTPTRVPTAMSFGRQIHTATALADGNVLVVGGYRSGDAALTSADLYDSAANTFSPTGSLISGRGLHTATLLDDGRVLVAGGGPASWLEHPGAFYATAELYDPAIGTFSATGSMTSPREAHTATKLNDGRVLITGGYDRDGHGVASAELYDPATGTFNPTGSMADARGFHTATLLANGRVLVTGGDPAAWMFPGPFLASAEIYNPKTGTFSATGAMSVGREMHTATLLADGHVLITGGVTHGSPAQSLGSAELYDPETGTFSTTGPMTVGRVYQTATLLADGRVLITGGCEHGRFYGDNPQFLASAELYDPTKGTFAATGSMSNRRTTARAALLADGRVLVTGGSGDYTATPDVAAPLASGEIYDPATGTFSSAGSGL